MTRATFRFYAELNDFLPAPIRGTAFEHEYSGRVSVKDMIESLGIPHTEVDLILADGRSVDFQYRVCGGDRISVYPVFESLDIQPLLRLRPEPLRVARFILDAHLGRLAAYLRLLGLDAVYRNDFADAELARRSALEERILLTRDRGLLKRSEVTRGYCVRSSAPREQAREVVERFDLRRAIAPFRRCLSCNGLLRPVEKQTVRDRLPPGTRNRFDEFYRCSDCGKIYWPGSHYARLQSLVADFLSSPGNPRGGFDPVGPRRLREFPGRSTTGSNSNLGLTYYDRIATQWDETTGTKGGAFKELVLNQILLDNLPGIDNRAILELGAGNGYFLPLALRRFSGQTPSAVFVTDQSRQLLRIARRRFRIRDAAYEILDVTKPFPFADGQFNLIIASMLFNEVPARGFKRALAECQRVMARGGLFLMAVTHPDFIGGLRKRGLLKATREGVLTMPGTGSLRLPVVVRSLENYRSSLRESGFQFREEEAYPTEEVINRKAGLRNAWKVPVALVYVCGKSE